MRHLITAAALLAAFIAPSVASAFHNGEQVIDGFRLPQNHRFESPDAKGKYEVVDINQVPALIRQGRFVFDRTGNTWIAKPGGGLNTTYLAAPTGSTGTASGTNQWQNIHGQVQNVSGSTLTLKADDNRQLTVDMSKIGPEIQKNLQPGEGVTVAAYQVSGNNVRAEFIQKDSSAGVQPSASVAQPVDEKAWQRIHGKVTSVNGAQLMLKADNGRDLTVDMKDVSPAIQKALTPGEGVEVTGHFKGDQNHVTAKFIQQDSSAKK